VTKYGPTYELLQDGTLTFATDTNYWADYNDEVAPFSEVIPNKADVNPDDDQKVTKPTDNKPANEVPADADAEKEPWWKFKGKDWESKGS
jgi:hypothetical protein